jgi:carbonic anhydrase
MAEQRSRREVLGAALGLTGGVLASTAGLGALDDVAAAADAAPPPQRFPKSPELALERLKAGNRRFAAGKARKPRQGTKRLVQVAEGQRPFAAILSCSDSRVPPEITFDQGLGDLFVVRIAGNTATDPFVIGSLEYAIEVVGSLVVFVLGHSECGAVKAAIDVETKGTTLPGDIGAVVQPILPAVQAVSGTTSGGLLEAATEENVKMAMESLGQVQIVADAVAAGKLLVAGGEYELATGRVDYLS